MVVVVDAVRESTTVEGTSPIVTLLGATVHARAFVEAAEFAAPPVAGVPYRIVAIDGAALAADEHEQGIGTFNADGTFTRSGSTWHRKGGVIGVGACDFSSGTKHIFVASTVDAVEDVAATPAAALAATLGTAATRNVGITAGTVAAGDDTRILAAAAAAARLGVEVIGSDTFAVNISTQAVKTRAATGAVTITDVTGLAPGLDCSVVITNTTASPIAVSVTPSGLDWYTQATLTLPAGESATLDLLSTTSSLSGVVAELRTDAVVMPQRTGLRVRSFGGWGLPANTAPQVYGGTIAVAPVNTLSLVPFLVDFDCTITDAIFSNSTTGPAAAAHIVLYSGHDDPAVGDVWATDPLIVDDLLYDSGPLSCATTAPKRVTGLSIPLKKGDVVWVGLFCPDLLTFQCIQVAQAVHPVWRGDNNNLSASRFVTSAFASPPASLGSSLTITTDGTSGSFARGLVGLRWTTP